MQVKRFFAADMRKAMQRVRDELKDDAAIISSRALAGGVELTAAKSALESTPASVSPELAAELRKTQAAIAEARARLKQSEESASGQLFAPPEGQSANDETPEVGSVSAPPEALPQTTGRVLAELREEFTQLRELVEVQLGSLAWRREQAERPQQTGLWFRLARLGLPAPLAASLLQQVAHISDTRLAFRHALAHLTRLLAVAGKDPLAEGGRLVLVGPSGMGKTTMLAKLASRYVLERGAGSLALVSMDAFRIGAHEQLKTLGRILDVPVFQAESPADLPELLERLAHKSLVLIDSSAGHQSIPPGLLPALGCKRFLLLSATCAPQVVEAALKNYGQEPLAGLVLTHLDEAASLGELLGCAIEQHLPVAWTSDGPRIPDDLHSAKAHQLVAQAVNLRGHTAPSEAQMAALFAQISAPKATTKAASRAVKAKPQQNNPRSPF